MATEAVIDGVRVGSLVEIHDLDAVQLDAYGQDLNGELGQVMSYGVGEAGKFLVCMICGFAGHFAPENVRLSSLKRPGEGGDEKSFDVLIAPMTEAYTLGHEIAVAMLEKGFCVLKICQAPQELDRTLEMLQALGENGKLARLPEEIEEHYIGFGCSGKVAWLDHDGIDKSLCQDEKLISLDGNLSYIAQAFQPFSGDVCGEFIDERTAALVCLTLTAEEEPEYPSPDGDDEALGTFLGTWRRSLLRAVHFAGPGTADLMLERKENEKADKLPKAPSSVAVNAPANTILLFRPDIYEYTCDVADETLMLITNFLSGAPQMVLAEVEGDVDWLTELSEGPPKPPGKDHLYILNTVTRLPGCWDNWLAFYDGLKAACDTIIEIPLMRWDVHLYWTPNEDSFETWQTTTRHQSYCEGAELFDNRHFEISNAEAAGMDPVQRLVCECGAQSLTMIGLTKKVANRKSSHAGCAVGNDKLDWMTCDKPAVQIGASMGGTSTVLAIIANRFSFLFNLKGPNFVCDTACSASLTSTHCAKMMMLERKYDPLEWFLSMGAHLCLSGGPFIGCSQSHMSSPKGRCFTFNASADGYLRGEGISGFLMKHGDYANDSEAILRATMAGQDGRSASLTAPNGPAQEEMIVKAIKEAQMVAPESTVWDCHGTGTSLGDPIEVGAVRKVQIKMQRHEPLMLGSMKTNIGHLEGGAAMASICKCIMHSKFAKCCPTLHLRTLNPHLEHAAFEAIFQTEAAEYPYIQGHSQVSSFGFGGSNAHGIFWGRNILAIPDADAGLIRKVKSKAFPEVRVTGRDPDEWDADFPDTRKLRRGAKFEIKVRSDDQPEDKLKWEFMEDGPDEDAEDDAFYSITGNFNGWDEDNMEQGHISGLHTATVGVPDSGDLEFRFLKNGDTSQVICPAEEVCRNRLGFIKGPAPGLQNRWLVATSAGAAVRIELFAKHGKISVMWMET